MTFYLECPTQKTGLAGWNINATHNFLCLPLNSFRRTWNFNSEKVVLSSRWKPCFHEASPVSGYLAALSVPLKERKDGTPFKRTSFFIDGHFTEISNFQFPISKGCLPFTKSFRRKIWSKSKWHMPFWVIPAENFREQRNSSDKVVLFFRMESSKRKLVFHFFKAMFDKNFRPWRVFFGKWNQFVQM